MQSAVRNTWRALAAVLFAALVVFAPVVRYGFVYDDHWTIEQSSGLLAPLPRVLHALLHGQAARLGLSDGTRPLMVLSAWIDRRLFGLAPRGWHAHSLVLYLLVVAAAFALLRLLLGRPRAALLGALAFAVAPLHAEVVAAVNYREDLLAALFTLVALWLFFRPRHVGRERPSPAEAVAVFVATLLATCAKESAVLLPVLCLGIAWARGEDLAFLRRREALLTAMGIAVVLYLNFRLGVPDDVPRTAERSLVARAFSTARFEVLAAASSLVPFFPAPERTHPGAASPLWLFGPLLLVVAVVRFRRSPVTRPLAVALVVALLAPLATTPLVGPVNELADRYFFLGTLGFAMVFGASVDRVLRVAPRARTFALASAGLLLAVAAVDASFARAPFRSDRDLWTNAVERAPDSARAWSGLARVRRLAGDLDGADAAARKAIALDPTYAPARLTRAYNLIARGELEEARAALLPLEGKSLPGLALARTCVALRPDAARACIAR